jgi:hypothetical protein
VIRVTDELSALRTITDEECITLIRLEIADIRASDDRADRKAQILFGFTGATLALTITAAAKWIGEPTPSAVTAILAYTSVLSFGAAAVLLGLAVRPQLQPSAAKASWIRLVLGRSSGRDALIRIISESPTDKVDRLSRLAYELALRARRKHRRIEWALAALFTGAVLLGTASVIHRLPFGS